MSQGWLTAAENMRCANLQLKLIYQVQFYDTHLHKTLTEIIIIGVFRFGLDSYHFLCIILAVYNQSSFWQLHHTNDSH